MKWSRERATLLLGNALIVVLVPVWGMLDAQIEPEVGRAFFVPRIFICTIALAAIAIVSATTHVIAHRIVSTITATLIAGMVAAMLPQVSAQNYPLYTFGLSLVFWGAGLLLTWPAKYAVVTMVATLAFSIATHARAGRLDAAFLGSLAYLGSAMAIGTPYAIVRERLERQAHAARSELERRNAELATALARVTEMQARLVEEEKLSALGRLLLQLSHELNNPLNVIQNNLEPLSGYVRAMSHTLEVAARDVPATSELHEIWRAEDLDFVRDDAPAAVATIEQATSRVRTIHHDLKALVRGEDLVFDAIDLDAVAADTISLVKRTLPPNVAIELACGSPPRVRGHAGKLGQLVLNLVCNAIDAVGATGTIRIETRAVADRVELTVADSGPGIPPKIRERIFEPFFTTKGFGRGTGLGLAVCRAIAQHHGGELVLDPPTDGGARFTLHLPLA